MVVYREGQGPCYTIIFVVTNSKPYAQMQVCQILFDFTLHFTGSHRIMRRLHFQVNRINAHSFNNEIDISLLKNLMYKNNLLTGK